MTKRLDALKVALNNEMKEHQFYLKNAERTKNAVGKAMFAQIAVEELEHHERLKQLHENWVKEQKWPETVPLKVKETTVKNVLQKATKKAPKGAKGDAEDLKAIRVAIEFEGKGAEYYARLRDQVTDPNALITETGRKVGVITTRGDEDIFLHERSAQKWKGYSYQDLLHHVTHHGNNPLVPRRLVKGVEGRLDMFTMEVIPIYEDMAVKAVEELLDEGVDAIVV